jgi:hypothetical protein
MPTTSESLMQPSLAQCVAGEDLELGEFISILTTTTEFLSHLWDRCDRTLAPEDVVRVRYIPHRAGHPLKIVAICLPFVYVQDVNKKVEVLDLRLTQVVRLNRDCAKEVWKLTKSGS